MNNPEKTKGAIKNGQPRENQKGNQEWTTQRKPKGIVRNGQTRENQRVLSGMDNPEAHTLLGTWHRTKTKKTKNKQH